MTAIAVKCHGRDGGCAFDDGDMTWDRTSDCPAVLDRPVSGAEMLTKLASLVRDADDDAGDVWEAEAMGLIARIREEHRKALAADRGEALEGAATLVEKAREHWCDPYMACARDWEERLAALPGEIRSLKDHEP